MTHRMARQEKEEKVPSVDVSISEDVRESNKIPVGNQERMIDLNGETVEIQMMVRDIIKKYPDVRTTMNLRELWTPSKQSRAKSIPRPQNAFMLLRKDVSREFCKANQSLSVRDSSAIASNRWNKISDDKKQFWIDLAEVCKKLHSYNYPDYKYCPERNKPTKPRRASATDTGRKGKKSRREQIAPYTLKSPSSRTVSLVDPPIVPSQTLVNESSTHTLKTFTTENYVRPTIHSPIYTTANENVSRIYQQKPTRNEVTTRFSDAETSPRANAYTISTHRPTTRSSAVNTRNRQAIINQTAPYPSRRHHPASNSVRSPRQMNTRSRTTAQEKYVQENNSHLDQSMPRQPSSTTISPTGHSLNNQQQFVYIDSAGPENFGERRHDSATLYNTIISPTTVYNSVVQPDPRLIMTQQSYLASPVLPVPPQCAPTTTYMRPTSDQQTYINPTLLATSPSFYTQPQMSRYINPNIISATQPSYQQPTDYLSSNPVHFQQTNADRMHQPFLMSSPPPTSETEYYYQPSDDLYILNHQLGLSGTIDPALLYQNDPLFTSFSYGRGPSPNL
ncbi:7704_t:CDS:1 [Acaulospora morrowiae]|uniref:7704_t:CDS:1 n=1 Tax=Acaulospora morrowiae TaxID=94023 RepID=A0A9N8V9N5_9GLOM|nr:7704_t:CDS:1 [Acaulospora morrowiae]